MALLEILLFLTVAYPLAFKSKLLAVVSSIYTNPSSAVRFKLLPIVPSFSFIEFVDVAFKSFLTLGVFTFILPTALMFALFALAIFKLPLLYPFIVTAPPSTTVSGVPFLTRSICSVIDAISTTSPATLIL